MNKKNILLIIAVTLVIVGTVLFFIKNNQTKKQTGNSIIQNIFPVLQTNQNPSNQSNNTPQNTNNSSQESENRKAIEQEVLEPIVSMVVVPNYIASSSVVYMKKNNGHIYLHKLGSTNKEDVLLSNTTLTFAQKAFFAFVGKNLHVITFYNKNKVLQNKYLVIDLEQSIPTVKELPLESDIIDVVESPNLDSFLLIQNINNQVVAINFNPKTNYRTRVYGFPQFSWNFDWLNKQLITLQTRPSAVMPGFLYRFTATENGLEKILDKTLELTTLMKPDGNYLLFSSNQNGSFSTRLKNLTSKQFIFLPFITIPDKCLWDKEVIVCQKITQNLSPGDLDKWYKGQISFTNGGFWEYGVNTEEFYQLATLPTKIDATDLKIDPNNYIIYFKNKLDNSLWSLDLSIARY